LAAGLALPVAAGVAIPERVRVGLATDLEEIVLPCCGGDLVVESGGDRVVVVSALRVEPAGRGPRPTAWRVQAAALKDEAQAEGLAARLTAALGEPAEAVFDAATDLYRVRLGRLASREEAERLLEAVLAQGVVGALVVAETRGTVEDGLRVSQGGRSWRVRGRWLALRNLDGSPVRLPQGRFRGRVLVFLNERGSLNLINELPLEQYLQGVVPQEMGPAVYGELEALKAQAVAARSYAVRNLGEFAAEGYDLCATPRCQVYGGIDAEHELSNEAVAATAGEILTWGDEVVDALYSSTCGGHTEDVQVVFPLKDEPYLRGVPCWEAGLAELAGSVPPGTAFPDGLTVELLPPAGPRAAPRMLAARLEHLAFLGGVEAHATTLDSLDRRAVQGALADLLDLGPDSALFVADEDLPYLLAALPADWPTEDLRLAAYLAKQGILVGDPGRPLGEEEIEPLLFQLALFLQVVERRDGRFVGLANGTLEVQVDGEHHTYALGRRLGTYRGRDGRFTAGTLRLLAGDRLTVYERAGELLALVHEIDPDGVAFDRTSNLSSWRRLRSDARLAELVATRYPGFRFQGLEIVKRGVSGRVGTLRLTGEGGESLTVEGLAVRWTLDLPDTLFTARRLAPPGREAGWLFTGRGWGHGVGLCQVGAYGMAVRGHDYRDILRHYYSGVELTPLEIVPRERFAAGRTSG
jgi:stage II sporulation protein D